MTFEMGSWSKGKTPASQVGNRGSSPRQSTEHEGSWSNGKTPVRHTGDPGSIPGESTRFVGRMFWKVAGYWLAGPYWNCGSHIVG